ncbi:MAG: hypothetical protein WCP82_09090, partial [Alphaproteobacteria bacterium]
ATYSGIALALVFFAALIHGWFVARRTPYDHATAAQIIETQFPDLKFALRTAAEQTPDQDSGRFNFLQRRVIDEAIRHAHRHPWALRTRRQARWTLVGHGTALAATLGLAVLVLQRSPVEVPWVVKAQKVAVSPGNVERERGSTVIIDARITGRSARRVELVWQDTAGKTGRVPMGRSLGDPVYAYTLPRVSTNLTYFVAYDGSETERFQLTVFEQPALVSADAELSYPKYTGLANKTIKNTRRISAVTGTQLQYDLSFNKPLASAVLRDETGAEIKLTPANADRTKFTMSMNIATTHTYSLALADDQARPNPAATPVVITAVENKPPTVALVFPRSDVRVSSLEEMRLSARASDDIGLNDYGLAIAVGDQAPTYVSLKGIAPPVPGPAAVPARGGAAAAANAPNTALVARFEEMLALEPKGIKPDDLVTWFAWAEDFGPDGKPRRVTSDLAFAEVRPFEEIFREASAAEAQAQQRQQQQRQQGGQQPQGGNTELLDLQRQISTAIFNLSKQTEPGATYAEDVQTLRDEQKRAQDMLQEAKADLTSARQQAAAEQADRFMNQVNENLATAGDKKSLDPLSPAWTGAQGAYQALLKLQARETRVAQQQRGQGGQQQQQRNRNQAQLNQLDFNQDRQQQDYQTQNDAQEPNTQEQRDQLAVQSRLNELARRQNDVNQRLQELQTALNAARDEPQKEQLRRELQRLEEEQRDMLATLDEARQRLDSLQPGEQTQQTRQQLDQARQDMQRTDDQLTQATRNSDQQAAQDNLQQALAAGNRTREQLDQTRQELQRSSSSQFAEQMRQARQQARDLASQQQQIEQQIQQAGQAGASQLDDSGQRQALAQNLDNQRANLGRLMQNLQEVTDASETTEPALHTQLYDLIRQQAQTQAQTDMSNRLQTGAELLRRGFVDQSRDAQAGVAQGLDQLRRGVERAADSVLGDETQTLQFAQNELNDLARQLEQDRQGSAGGQQAAQDPGANGQQQVAQNGQAGAQGGQPGGNNSGENGNQPGGQNPNGQPGTQGSQSGALAQNDPNGAGRQPGGQGTQPGTSEDFRTQAPDSNLAQNGAAGQRGQPGQSGAQGQPGQGDATSEQFAQNSGQPGAGQGQQPGQRGGAGQQPGQRGGQAGLSGQPGDLAQNDPNAAGQQPGGQGQGRQGGAGQPNGQVGQPGALAQGAAQPGGQGQGQQPGQRGGQGQSGGQPGDLAQNDTNGAGQQPGQGQGNPGQPGGQGGRGQQPGQRGGRGGQQTGDLAQNGQNPGGQQPGQAGAGGGQQSGQPGQRGGQGQAGGQLAQNGGNRQNGGGGGAFN